PALRHRPRPPRRVDPGLPDRLDPPGRHDARAGQAPDARGGCGPDPRVDRGDARDPVTQETAPAEPVFLRFSGGPGAPHGGRDRAGTIAVSSPKYRRTMRKVWDTFFLGKNFIPHCRKRLYRRFSTLRP